jgi:hypothetical protein
MCTLSILMLLQIAALEIRRSPFIASNTSCIRRTIYTKTLIGKQKVSSCNSHANRDTSSDVTGVEPERPVAGPYETLLLRSGGLKLHIPECGYNRLKGVVGDYKRAMSVYRVAANCRIEYQTFRPCVTIFRMHLLFLTPAKCSSFLRRHFSDYKRNSQRG